MLADIWQQLESMTKQIRSVYIVKYQNLGYIPAVSSSKHKVFPFGMLTHQQRSVGRICAPAQVPIE